MYSNREIMPARLAATLPVQRHCVGETLDGKICCKMQERVSSRLVESDRRQISQFAEVRIGA